MLINRTTLGYITLTAITFLLVATGCKRKIEERPIFASAEYFAPTQVATGGELNIHGFALDGAEVKIDGLKAEQVSLIKSDSSSDERMILVVKLPESLSEGEYTVTVTYSDGESIEFTAPIVVGSASGVQELLISDFDQGGIRPAVATSDFNNGQWSAESAAQTTIGIKDSDLDVTSSPAGGNFAFARAPASGILPGTFGFVASIASRNEIGNDFVTNWPNNFFDYPLSSLTLEEDDDISDFYINFYINFNGNIQDQLRIFLGSSNEGNGFKYAYTIYSSETANVNVSGSFERLSDDKSWNHLSIPLSNFKCNFGFGPSATTQCDANFEAEDLLGINQILFNISDDFNNIYDPECCSGSSNIKCCSSAIKSQVGIYIDHVVISKGGPALDYSK